ncbi:MAG: transglutaminase domain-containing protein, partial [Thermoanaerobaculia bacterium]
MSSATYVVLMALTVTILRPGLVAAQLPPVPPQSPLGHHDPHEGHKHLPPPEDLRLAETLNELADKLSDLERKSGGDLDAAGDELGQLQERIVELDRAVREEFDRIGERLASAGSSEAVRQRHQQARDAYAGEMKKLLSNLDGMRQASDPAAKSAAARAALEQLVSGPRARPHQPLDPDNLPFGRAKAEKRPPRLTHGEFQQLISGGAVPADKAMDAADDSAKALVPPLPEDTAPNEDVQITPEIEALASSLGGNPLEIYRWTHDNIDFIPTYGSTQGSQMTLQSKRGNAFDIASLLIALLRAADVPARYVLGTVEIPSAQVQNWLGDVETPQVAQQVLGQGGIPNVGLLQGGELTHIRVEHLWVQAWVDYVPSRGAKPQQGDTWVPMDASFKLHEFTEPAGLFAAAPFDSEGLQAQVLANATVDEALGLISGIDEDLIFAAVEDYAQDAGEFFLDGGLDPGREALLGGRAIIPTTATVLAGSLPFEIVAQGDAVATLPASLRLSVTLNGFSSAIDRALGNPSFAHTISLPALNSKRLGVTYEPATAADAQIIDDAIANGDTTLPLYLIDVKPVIKVDEDVVSTGPTVGM